MKLFNKIKNKIVSAYRIYKTYDFSLILNMVINRIRKRHYEDFLIEDIPYKFQFLKRHYVNLLEECRKNPITHNTNNGPIWVCWWQGEEQMPEITRFCYNNLKNCIPDGRKLILVHKDNYKDFVDIPNYIMEKLHQGIISLIHFSDILRMSLLAKYGGLWIDSTVFVNGKIPETVFNHSYFSGREPYKRPCVCRCEYTVYLIGAAAGAPWIVYARDFLYEYWKKSWKLLDYILINYILTLALDSIPELRDNVMKGIINTPHINVFQEKRNEPCDSNIYSQLMRECIFYKLSNKLDFKEVDTKGNPTYYGMLRKNSYTL